MKQYNRIEFLWSMRMKIIVFDVYFDCVFRAFHDLHTLQESRCVKVSQRDKPPEQKHILV